MFYKNFKDLFAVKKSQGIKRVVLAGAEDPYALEAVLFAAKEGNLKYVLVGNEKITCEVANSLGYDLNIDEIIKAASPKEVAFLAVEQIRLNQGDFLMKGKMETSTLLKQVVSKNEGIGTGKTMSHLAIIESPYYHKLLGITDGGMILYPDFQEKKAIIKNAVEFFHCLGYENPKVSIMSALEVVNPKMQETVDAYDLKSFSQNSEYFGKCIVEGPISFDLAVNNESALIKDYESSVAGDTDIMIMPNITAGNLTAKALAYLGQAKFAGCVVGAKVPIVVTSRGSSFEEKYISLLLSAAIV